MVTPTCHLVQCRSSCIRASIQSICVTSISCYSLVTSNRIRVQRYQPFVNSSLFWIECRRCVLCHKQDSAAKQRNIDECELKIRAVAGTWIEESHPDTVTMISLHLASPFHTFIDRVTVLTIAVELLSYSSWQTARQTGQFIGENIPQSRYWPRDALHVSGRLNIGVILRPPKSTVLFVDFESLLDEIMAFSDKLLICGDVNCRSYVTDVVDIASQLKAVLIEHDLAQHLMSPTHRLNGWLAS